VIKDNIISGLTVALVSIPLSSAIAIAYGTTPSRGLHTAIYAPFIGALLGGSNYNILGIASSLVNIVSGLTMVHGE